jgi:hypothetical protein
MLLIIPLNYYFKEISVSRAVDLGGGSEEIERSGILNNWGNNTI